MFEMITIGPHEEDSDLSVLALWANNSSAINGKIQSQPLSRLFLLPEIQFATNNFDTRFVVGIGGFGKVYKGFIDGGATTVAIKRLNSASKQGADEFWNDIRMLSELRHRHLVPLIGYCNQSDKMILVYQYITQGTLADNLYETTRGNEDHGIRYINLTWEQRLHIGLGAARGLDYLHSGTRQSFIHRDVKTTNILLDENWVAKISDFGLSKGPFSISQTHITTAVKGTFGYLDPHYFMTQRITKKLDVYAFGVVMLELLCARPALDPILEDDQISLVLWVQEHIEKGTLYRIIDPTVREQISLPSLWYFMEIASKCLQNRPSKRPTMADVVAGLEFILLLV